MRCLKDYDLQMYDLCDHKQHFSLYTFNGEENCLVWELQRAYTNQSISRTYQQQLFFRIIVSHLANSMLWELGIISLFKPEKTVKVGLDAHEWSQCSGSQQMYNISGGYKLIHLKYSQQWIWHNSNHHKMGTQIAAHHAWTTKGPGRNLVKRNKLTAGHLYCTMMSLCILWMSF